MLESLLQDNPFCDILMRKVSDYYKDEEHRKQFEKWYREKYGKEYEWRDAHDKQQEAGKQL